MSDVQKAFEPYCDLWKRVDDWTAWHKGWMNDSFLSLDAEEVNTHTVVWRSSHGLRIAKYDHMSYCAIPFRLVTLSDVLVYQQGVFIECVAQADG